MRLATEVSRPSRIEAKASARRSDLLQVKSMARRGQWNDTVWIDLHSGGVPQGSRGPTGPTGRSDHDRPEGKKREVARIRSLLRTRSSAGGRVPETSAGSSAWLIPSRVAGEYSVSRQAPCFCSGGRSATSCRSARKAPPDRDLGASPERRGAANPGGRRRLR